MFIYRDFVDDRRVGIISDVSDNVRECFRYPGRKIYVFKENLIDIHQRLFSKIMQVYALIMYVVHFLENRFCITGLNQSQEIFDQGL